MKVKVVDLEKLRVVVTSSGLFKAVGDAETLNINPKKGTNVWNITLKVSDKKAEFLVHMLVQTKKFSDVCLSRLIKNTALKLKEITETHNNFNEMVDDIFKINKYIATAMDLNQNRK